MKFDLWAGHIVCRIVNIPPQVQTILVCNAAKIMVLQFRNDSKNAF